MNLTLNQIGALTGLINTGVGRSAGMLNEMVNTRVYLQVPPIKVFPPLEAKRKLERLGRNRLATVQLLFKGPFSGTAALVFRHETASKLVSILTGEGLGSHDPDSVRAGTFSEVGSIVINGVMDSIGNVLKERISYSFPKYTENTIENLLTPKGFDPNGTVLLTWTYLMMERLRIEGDIILIFKVGSFDTLLPAIDTINSDSGAQS